MNKDQVNIICFSSQNWDNDLWTNKQHIMSRLARRGFRVLYVNKGKESIGKYVRKGSLRGVKELDVNLQLAHSFRIPLRKLSRKFEYYNDFGLKVDLVKRYVSTCEGSVVLWVYHPGYGQYLRRIKRNCFVLYDCVDDYATFPEYEREDLRVWIQESEAVLLEVADLVVTSSANLYEEKRLLNKNTHLIHNVGDFEHFNRVEKESFSLPDLLRATRVPRIGFYGAISNHKVDLELIRRIAVERPEWSVCLMGPIGVGDKETDVSKLAELANVTLTGKIDYSEMPAHLTHMDVLMIPYRITKHTKSVFPIKFFECLATGKPLVITPLPALEEYYPYVKVGQTSSEFLRHVEDCLRSDSPEPRNKRIKLSEKNDWDARIDRILGKIAETGFVNPGSRDFLEARSVNTEQ